jgi:hypothetical protein
MKAIINIFMVIVMAVALTWVVMFSIDFGKSIGSCPHDTITDEILECMELDYEKVTGLFKCYPRKDGAVLLRKLK